MEKKFLPIGSVVLLKDGTKKVMIIGFCPQSKDDPKVYDYLGCVYPEGVLTSNISLVFNHDQIVEVVFKGLENEEEKHFKEKLDEEIKKGNVKVGGEINDSPNVEPVTPTVTETVETNEAPIVESNDVPNVEPSNFDVPSLDSIIGTSNNESIENIETF